MLETGLSRDLSRKKSLVRPERRRNDPEDPNYYYRKHAQKMDVLPSSTGRDPQMEEELLELTADVAATHVDPASAELGDADEKDIARRGSRRTPGKLTRRATEQV